MAYDSNHKFKLKKFLLFPCTRQVHHPIVKKIKYTTRCTWFFLIVTGLMVNPFSFKQFSSFLKSMLVSF